jgi:predicted homoserine dehydrogenase-like protein
MSVLSAALRNEATGSPTGWRADVVAVAKRDLRAGEVLDGEGGYTVYGKLMPAADSLAIGGLPIGLAHGVELAADVLADQPVRWIDVRIKEEHAAHRLRRQLERGGPATA